MKLLFERPEPEVRPPGRGTDESQRSPARHLRVALFSDSLPERNGTGAYYHDLAGQLGPELGVLKMFQPAQKARYLRLSLPMPGDPMQRLITPNVPRISKEFKAMRPDVVVAVTPGPFGLLGLYLARRSGVKFITAFHTDFEQLAKIYWNPVSRTVANGLLRGVNRLLCQRSETVLINNSKLRGDVEKLGARSVEVMGTPLQSEFLDRPMKAPPAGVRQVCFAGRLAAEKSVDRIIDAAADFPEVRFVIGGDGPLRGRLEASARDLGNVRFTGWLSRGELVGLLDDSHMLLLPSQLETFGSVALEAMARGRPALVSANAGIHDWWQLREGLVALGSGEILAGAMRRVFEMPAEVLRKKAAAARVAAERLHAETIGQWVEVLLRHSGAGK